MGVCHSLPFKSEHFYRRAGLFSFPEHTSFRPHILAQAALWLDLSIHRDRCPSVEDRVIPFAIINLQRGILHLVD